MRSSCGRNPRRRSRAASSRSTPRTIAAVKAIWKATWACSIPGTRSGSDAAQTTPAPNWRSSSTPTRRSRVRHQSQATARSWTTKSAEPTVSCASSTRGLNVKGVATSSGSRAAQAPQGQAAADAGPGSAPARATPRSRSAAVVSIARAKGSSVDAGHPEPAQAVADGDRLGRDHEARDHTGRHHDAGRSQGLDRHADASAWRSSATWRAPRGRGITSSACLRRPGAGQPTGAVASASSSTRSRTRSSSALSTVNTSAVTQAVCTSGSAKPSTTTAT